MLQSGCCGQGFESWRFQLQKFRLQVSRKMAVACLVAVTWVFSTVRHSCVLAGALALPKM